MVVVVVDGSFGEGVGVVIEADGEVVEELHVGCVGVEGFEAEAHGAGGGFAGIVDWRASSLFGRGAHDFGGEGVAVLPRR